MARKDSQKIAERKISEALRSKAKQLDLSRLDLTSLPADIGKLQSLQELNLDNTRLTSLPAVIGQLQSNCCQGLGVGPCFRRSASKRRCTEVCLPAEWVGRGGDFRAWGSALSHRNVHTAASRLAQPNRTRTGTIRAIFSCGIYKQPRPFFHLLWPAARLRLVTSPQICHTLLLIAIRHQPREKIYGLGTRKDSAGQSRTLAKARSQQCRSHRNTDRSF
jgi:Leucine-rich repeat (LRR) protein